MPPTVFIVFVWFLFLGLVFYVLWNSTSEISKKALSNIRKAWFAIYLFGALVYWTTEPASIFNHWENYLIVAVVFLVVDAFIFLGLYLKKAGDYEFGIYADDVKELMDTLANYRDKVDKTHGLIVTKVHGEVHTTEENYLEKLQDLLQLYATAQNLLIDLYPYETTEEVNVLAERYRNHSYVKIESFLALNHTYYSEDAKLALFPIEFQRKPMIIEVRSPVAVSEVDLQLLDMLLNAYVASTEFPEASRHTEATTSTHESLTRNTRAKRARVSSANIGVSPETLKLEELEERMLRKLEKNRYTIGTERK